MKKTIISLFDFTGIWSKPYKENGYNVIQVDIKHGIDIMTWDYKSIPKEDVYGILAAVPCTDFAVSGARWFKDKDKDGRTEKSINLVNKTLEIIEYFEPEFWVIENPISRIHNLVPGIGKPKYYFHPYEFQGYTFADNNYSKKTALYGKFTNPIKMFDENEEIDKKYIHYLGSAGKNKRSETPHGFAKAFYITNHKKEEL